MSLDEASARTRAGMFFAIAAYVWWGFSPLYFRALESASPIEILAHRVIWSVPLLMLLVTYNRAWSRFLDAVTVGKTLFMLSVTAVLVAVNWYVFIWAVAHAQLVEASLGYFINPLVSVLLGVIVLGERLRPLAWLAIAMAAVSVGILLLQFGHWPWIALMLAFSFGAYGVLRKMLGVGSDVGLLIETLVLLPLAGYWLSGGLIDSLVFGSDLQITLLLLCAGFVTAVPLVCFAASALRLPLSTLGFFQYLSPTLSLLLAIWVFNEPFEAADVIAFAGIWLALAVFSFDGIGYRSPKTL